MSLITKKYHLLKHSTVFKLFYKKILGKKDGEKNVNKKKKEMFVFKKQTTFVRDALAR